MNLGSTSAPALQIPDLEAQMPPPSDDQASNAPSFYAHKPLSSRTSVEAQDEPSSSPPIDQSEQGNETQHTTQSKSRWTPWRPGGPYITTVPESKTTKEDWIKAMEESDDGMCKGRREQIDTLIIFAGLFSATVTAFTIESYQWLSESPADTLARLQLRALLNATLDPAAVDSLAPIKFSVSPSSVWINTLWFASLALTLAAAIVSILCKQWLYEYQRYENVTTEDSFLIHGLRYRGLRAWRVPEIIASLPILLQTALVLFLFGVLALLWSFQSVTASITTVIVGLTFLFLAATTILPVVQYIYPKFDTQCAYKSSQSWTFFFVSGSWLFDSNMFTNWQALDRWEVNCIYAGAGHTLSRVYELLSNDLDVFLSIYRFLADASSAPNTEADLNVLFDFIDGLDTSRRDGIVEAISPLLPLDPNANTKALLRRLEQLKGYVKQYYHFCGKLRPELKVASVSFKSSFSQPGAPTPAYNSRVQKTLSEFLKADNHVSNQAVFNRYVEHWVKAFDGMGEEVPWTMSDSDKKQWARTIGPFSRALLDETTWDSDVAVHFVQMHSHLLKTNQFSPEALYSFSTAYAGLMESYRRTDYEPPPFILLEDIQEWINQMPESDLRTKIRNATHILCDLVLGDNIFVDRPHSRSSNLEIQYLISFARFLVDFHDRQDVLDLHSRWETNITNKALPILRGYLEQHTPAVP